MVQNNGNPLTAPVEKGIQSLKGTVDVQVVGHGKLGKLADKDGGEIAQFVLARQYMNKGEFKKAITELEGVDVNDTYVQIMSIGLQADAYSELENYVEAAKLYKTAADMNENELTTPMYLMKAGLCLEEINNFEKATEYYITIKENYSAFASQKIIDKYIARTENKTSK